MDLCCVYCGRKARYMYKGTSLCKDHLSKEFCSAEGSQNTEVIVIDAPAVPE